MKKRRAEARSMKDRRSERGMTLIETLVAVIVFTVVFITALLLYQNASRAYLRTDAAVIQQQNMRFTMDRVSDALRDAGAGHNMLGARNLADEQIEGVWESAVFIRGDYDGKREDGLDGGTDLENTTFPIVTTGNDEIVGFVLRKEGANSQSLTMNIDLTGTGRDAIYTNDASIAGEESVTVDVAATTLAQQTNPPYDLAKVTFNAAGQPQYEVIASNIRQLQFGYFPATGTTAVTAYGGANAERDERRTIRKIDVRLQGMSDRTDFDYNKDGGFRFFTLRQTILVVNLGVIGGRHNPVPAISLPVPDYITACTGHCRHHLIQWAATPAVTTYRLQISAPADGAVAAYTNTVDVAATQYEFEEPVEDKNAGINRTFTFKVAAMSGYTEGPYTDAVARAYVNELPESTPTAPQNVLAAGSQSEYAMTLTWDAVSSNTGLVTSTNLCESAGSIGGGSAPPSPWNAQAVDLGPSKVFRVRSDGTTNGADASTDVSNEALGAASNAVSNTAFLDRTAAPCTPYFYRVKACDLCTEESVFSASMSTPVAFDLPSGVNPAKPPMAPTPVGPILSDGINYNVQLQWNPVVQTDTSRPAATAHYRLRRFSSTTQGGPFTLQEEFELYDATIGPIDVVPVQDGAGQNLYYRYDVQAIYDCQSPRIGVASDPYDLACTPPVGTSIAISKPVANDVFTRGSEASVELELDTESTGWTSAQISIQDENGDVVPGFPLTASGAPNGSGFYTFTPWNIADTTAIPDGFYTVRAAGNVNGCRAVADAVTIKIETVVCGQRIVSAVYTGNGSSFARTMTFRIENSCTNAVVINRIVPTYQGVLAGITITNLTGSVVHYNNATGASSGVSMPFTSNLTLAAGTVATPSLSTLFTFTFSDNFTSTGAHNSGTTGKFTSIQANVISPTAVTEQLVDAAFIP